MLIVSPLGSCRARGCRWPRRRRLSRATGGSFRRKCAALLTGSGSGVRFRSEQGKVLNPGGFSGFSPSSTRAAGPAATRRRQRSYALSGTAPIRWPGPEQPPAMISGDLTPHCDQLLRRTWAVVPRPVYTQVSGHGELSASDCHYPWQSASSGTQRARDCLSEDDCCTLQGMACVRSGQAAPGPWFLAGGGAEAPRLRGGS